MTYNSEGNSIIAIDGVTFNDYKISFEERVKACELHEQELAKNALHFLKIVKKFCDETSCEDCLIKKTNGDKCFIDRQWPDCPWAWNIDDIIEEIQS